MCVIIIIWCVCRSNYLFWFCLVCSPTFNFALQGFQQSCNNFLIAGGLNLFGRDEASHSNALFQHTPKTIPSTAMSWSVHRAMSISSPPTVISPCRSQAVAGDSGDNNIFLVTVRGLTLIDCSCSIGTGVVHTTGSDCSWSVITVGTFLQLLQVLSGTQTSENIIYYSTAACMGYTKVSNANGRYLIARGTIDWSWSVLGIDVELTEMVVGLLVLCVCMCTCQ